jgi:signal transduction histidine kinase
MCRADLRVFESALSAPGLARAFVAAHIEADLAGTDALCAAELVVSELVTNAVNASARRLEVDIDLHRECLVLGVTDYGPGTPRRQDALPHQTHGRGLRIVAAISRNWGTTPHRGGKRVWAELDVTGHDSWDCLLPPTGATPPPR